MMVDPKYGAISDIMLYLLLYRQYYITLQKTHQYNIGHLFMSVSNNANVIIEMYHILHSVQSSVQSSIDDVISYCKIRRAKFSYNSQSNNFNISTSEQKK